MKAEGNHTFLPGKLPIDVLEKLLNRYTLTDPRVIVGAKIGEDAAVIEEKDRYLVAKTDPITFVAEDLGWYVIHVNANDLATRGARPQWFLATLRVWAGVVPQQPPMILTPASSRLGTQEANSSGDWV